MPLVLGSIAELQGGVVRGGPSTAPGGTGFPTGGGALRFSGFATPSVIANTAAETLFTQYTIPANTVNKVGTLIRLRAGFKFSTTGTPTLQFRAWIGGLLGLRILNTGFTCALNVSNNAIVSEADTMVDAAPLTAANMRYGYGALVLSDATAGTAPATVYANPTVAGGPTGVIDWTASQTIGFSVQWGAAAAGNTITLYAMTVEIEYPLSVG